VRLFYHKRAILESTIFYFIKTANLRGLSAGINCNTAKCLSNFNIKILSSAIKQDPNTPDKVQLITSGILLVNNRSPAAKQLASNFGFLRNFCTRTPNPCAFYKQNVLINLFIYCKNTDLHRSQLIHALRQNVHRPDVEQFHNNQQGYNLDLTRLIC